MKKKILSRMAGTRSVLKRVGSSVTAWETTRQDKALLGVVKQCKWIEGCSSKR